MEIKAECGSCGQHYSVDQTYLGEQIVCPNCNQQTTVRPIAPKGPVVSAQEVQTNVRQGAAIGGWICFGIGAVVMFIPIPTWFIYIPLFVASFILSIVAMAQGRVKSGISLLLVNIICAPILFVIAFTLGLVTWAGALHELARQEQLATITNAASAILPDTTTTNKNVDETAVQGAGAAGSQKPATKAPDAEKIEGAFGQKLGGEFNPSLAISNSQLSDGTLMYEYNFGNTFRSFNHYYVLITPGTHKIYSILAAANFDNESLAEKEQAVVMEMLAQKYGPTAEQTPSEVIDHDETIRQGNRDVGTKIAGSTDVILYILYYDDDLATLAEKERIANEVQHSDKTGL